MKKILIGGVFNMEKLLQIHSAPAHPKKESMFVIFVITNRSTEQLELCGWNYKTPAYADSYFFTTKNESWIPNCL